MLGQGPLRQGAVAERVYGTAATITAEPQLGRSSVSVSAHLVSTITSATLSTATLAATTEPPPLSPSPLSPPLPSPPPPSPPPPSPPPRHHLGAHLVSREERPGQGGGGVGGLHSRHHMGACCCSARARDAVYRAHQCPAPHEKHALHGIAFVDEMVHRPKPRLARGLGIQRGALQRASARPLSPMQT